MTLRWIPDTCDCVILFSIDPVTFVQWEKRCELHKALSGQTWLDAVITHNLSFQIAGASQNSAAMRAANVTSKKAEKANIKASGPTTTNSAFIRPRSWQ